MMSIFKVIIMMRQDLAYGNKNKYTVTVTVTVTAWACQSARARNNRHWSLGLFVKIVYFHPMRKKIRNYKTMNHEISQPQFLHRGAYVVGRQDFLNQCDTNITNIIDSEKCSGETTRRIPAAGCGAARREVCHGGSGRNVRKNTYLTVTQALTTEK
jgi:hypothetical protein